MEPIFFPDYLPYWVKKFEAKRENKGVDNVSYFQPEFELSKLIEADPAREIHRQVFEGISFMIVAMISRSDMNARKNETDLEVNALIEVLSEQSFEGLLVKSTENPWAKYLTDYCNHFYDVVKKHPTPRKGEFTDELLSNTQKRCAVAHELKRILMIRLSQENKIFGTFYRIFHKKKKEEFDELQDIIEKLNQIINKEPKASQLAESNIAITTPSFTPNIYKRILLLGVGVVMIISVLLGLAARTGKYSKSSSTSAGENTSSTSVCFADSKVDLKQSMEEYKGISNNKDKVIARLKIHQALVDEIEVYSFLNPAIKVEDSGKCKSIVRERKAYKYINGRFLPKASGTDPDERDHYVNKTIAHLIRATAESDEKYQSVVNAMEQCSKEMDCIQKLLNRGKKS
jgi:hypothetical protein